MECGIFFAFVVIIIVALIVVGNKNVKAKAAEEKKQDDADTQFLKDEIREHIETLSRKYHQTVFRDDYGNFVFTAWQREVDYFIDRVLMIDKEFDYARYWKAKELIRTMIPRTSNSKYINEPKEQSSPRDFEAQCLEALKARGWEGRTTKTTGDQGVDIIATKNGKRLIVQCKLYTNPVGNKAVQEAIAGRAYEKADYAAVITNSTFTTPAKQLASTASVFLLHYQDISNIDKILSNNFTKHSSIQDLTCPKCDTKINYEKEHKGTICPNCQSLSYFKFVSGEPTTLLVMR